MTISNLFSTAAADHHADADANTGAAIEHSQKDLRVALTHQLDHYCSRYRQEQELLMPLRTQLALGVNPLDRHSMPGHITASGIVTHEGKLLMIFHPFLKRWLQPGGHVEPDETPAQAAWRELFEETGIHGSMHVWHEHHAIPLDINIHQIPANPKKQEPAHWHYDFRYVFTSDGVIHGAGEHDHLVAWKNFPEIAEDNLQGLIRKLKSEQLLAS